jgi:probable O-glycosylation ligase (exosortase A-associated)
MRDILVTAIIFGLLPFIFRRPWVGIMLWSWLAYMNPHRQAWGFAYDFPFSMVVGLTTIVAFAFMRDKKPFIWTRETVVWVLFVAWMFLTTFFAFYQDLAWLQWNKVWKIHLMLLLIMLMIREREHLDWMIWVIAVSLGYYGFKGGIFTIAHGGAFRVQGPAGTFIGGNNEMALALVMVIPLIRYLHLQARHWFIRFGLVSVMLMTGVAAIGSQSRGGLVAMAAMAVFLWLKSRSKMITGFYIAITVVIIGSVMPQEWYDRMNTIKTYQEDSSALGRINAWHTAFNIAKDRVTGGGYETFQPATFRRYAPEVHRVHDVHSIYFEVMGEHGFTGFTLFMLLGLFTWMRARQVIRFSRGNPDRKWAADLVGMIQVSLIGYAAGGAFLGLAYWDLPYHLMLMVLLTAKCVGALDKPEPVKIPPSLNSSFRANSS